MTKTVITTALVTLAITGLLGYALGLHHSITSDECHVTDHDEKTGTTYITCPGKGETL